MATQPATQIKPRRHCAFMWGRGLRRSSSPPPAPYRSDEGRASSEPNTGSTCFQALRQSLGAGLGHGHLQPLPHPRLLPRTLKLCSRQRAPKGCVAAFWTKGRAAGLPNCWPTAFTPQVISGEAGLPTSAHGAKPWMWGRASGISVAGPGPVPIGRGQATKKWQSRAANPANYFRHSSDMSSSTPREDQAV